VSGAFRERLHRLDLRVYAAIAEAGTPRLDAFMARLTSAADYSRLSLAAAAALSLAGGPEGRRASLRGLTCLGVTALGVNAVVKPLTRRRRPDPVAAGIPAARRVRMPRSASFPSGHTAAAVAFAAGVGRELPAAGAALGALAAAVGYSRVHTGVHYPGDVVAGALCGLAAAAVADRAWREAAAPPE